MSKPAPINIYPKMAPAPAKSSEVRKYGDAVHAYPTVCRPESGRTKQSDLAQTNIVELINSYQPGSDLTHIRSAIENYGDFTNLPTFHEAKVAIANAEAAFNSYPAAVRTRMRNSPGYFLEFMEDEQNVDEAVSLGIVDPPEGWIHPDEREPEPVVDPPPPEPPAPE